MDSEAPVRLTRTRDTSSEHQLRTKDSCLAMTFGEQVLVQSFSGGRDVRLEGSLRIEIHVEPECEVTM